VVLDLKNSERFQFGDQVAGIRYVKDTCERPRIYFRSDQEIQYAKHITYSEGVGQIFTNLGKVHEE
jgi:hypothetical protein